MLPPSRRLRWGYRSPAASVLIGTIVVVIFTSGSNNVHWMSDSGTAGFVVEACLSCWLLSARQRFTNRSDAYPVGASRRRFQNAAAAAEQNVDDKGTKTFVGEQRMSCFSPGRFQKHMIPRSGSRNSTAAGNGQYHVVRRGPEGRRFQPWRNSSSLSSLPPSPSSLTRLYGSRGTGEEEEDKTDSVEKKGDDTEEEDDDPSLRQDESEEALAARKMAQLEQALGLQEENEGPKKTTLQDDDGKTKNDADAASASMVGAIRFYKSWISPLLPPACRFVPTCSQYGVQAIQEFGPMRGAILTAWRLLRCSPLGGRGYDPPRWPPVPYNYASY